jgi:transposase
MKKKNITLMLLWKEYKRDNPDGLMYTQYCERYRAFKKSNQISMHIEHRAGEEIQVDWAGSTVPYIEPSTGEAKAGICTLTSKVFHKGKFYKFLC